MAPRGVPRAGGRQDLLQAATQLLEEGGPDTVTVRAIAARAGVATGLLYTHFSDRDDLLVALVGDRFQIQAADGEALLLRAGTGSVEANLTAFGRSAVSPAGIALARLMMSRPDLAERARRALGAADSPGLDQLEHAVAEYLHAEQGVERVHRDVDCTAAALLLINGWHRLLMRGPTGTPTSQDDADRLVRTLITGLSPTSSS